MEERILAQLKTLHRDRRCRSLPAWLGCVSACYHRSGDLLLVAIIPS
jgi:hypothetical protein